MNRYLTAYPRRFPIGLLIGDDFFQINSHLSRDYFFDKERQDYLTSLSPELLIQYLLQIFQIDDPESLELAFSLGRYKIDDNYEPNNQNIIELIVVADESISRSFDRISEIRISFKSSVDWTFLQDYVSLVNEEKGIKLFNAKRPPYNYLRRIECSKKSIHFFFHRDENDKKVINEEYNEYVNDIDRRAK
jgi:hypothetical protein